VDTERENLLNPAATPKASYVERTLADESGVFVAASDYVKALPASIAKWIPGPYMMLGTDGFGRSESRDALRDFFEVDARYIVLAALQALVKEKKIKPAVIEKALKDLDIRPGKPNPMYA
jgi:pyruvate dehydrogenase E1 component